MKRYDTATIWLCQCCTMVLANGECCDDDTHGGDGCEPLSKIDTEITLGLMAEEHDESCQVKITGEYSDNEECDCDRRSFSWSWCAGCNSKLGGERHAATLWWDHVPEPYEPVGDDYRDV